MKIMDLKAKTVDLLNERKQTARAVFESARFQQQLELLAEKMDVPLQGIAEQALAGLEEMVTVQNPAFIAAFNHGLGPMHTRAWTIDADVGALNRLKELNERHGLIFLPTHRSYADGYILSKVMRDNGMKRNHILGGDNLGFFPLGTIVRRAGAILIRRSFRDDEVYKLVVREYLAWIAAARQNLEWYMEGGRSRTGKLRPPRYGLLRFLTSAIQTGGVDDMLLVPVSTTYDQLHEVSRMAEEELGAAKVKENMFWLARYGRTQQKWIGNAYVRFGEPLSLKEALSRADEEGGGKWTVAKIAFEVFKRIDKVTPVTEVALVTLSLLGVRGRALTLEEVYEQVQPLLDYAEERGLPSSHLDLLRTRTGVRNTLETLEKSAVISHYDAGLEPVYEIEDGQHGVAAFYRNSAIHWFVNRAIFEVAMLDTSHDGVFGPMEQAWSSSMALRDLLKYEFFFSDKNEFREEQKAESRLVDPKFRQSIAKSENHLDLLLSVPFLMAHRVLGPFLESYFIVADRLAAHSTHLPVDKSALLQECVDVGRQYVKQRRVKHPEAVSKEVFGNALMLADNRQLLEPNTEALAQRRQAFLDELSQILARVNAIGDLDKRRHSDSPRPGDSSSEDSEMASPATEEEKVSNA